MNFRIAFVLGLLFAISAAAVAQQPPALVADPSAPHVGDVVVVQESAAL